MSLITLIVVIVIVGFLLWVIRSLIPMDDTVRKILTAVVVIVLLFWILRAFGLFGYLETIRI